MLKEASHLVRDLPAAQIVYLLTHDVQEDMALAVVLQLGVALEALQ